jgi:hypothetical protein
MSEAATLRAIEKVADVLANIGRRMDAIEARRDSVVQARETSRLIRADALKERRREEAREAERERARGRAERRALAIADGVVDAWRLRGNDSLSPYGRELPAIVADETLPQYQRRTLNIIANYLPGDHKFAAYNFEDRQKVPLDVLPILAEDVFRDAKSAATRADTVPRGQMREVVVRDPNSNAITERRFYGQRPFTDDFVRRGRRVKNFIGRDINGLPLPLRY